MSQDGSAHRPPWGGMGASATHTAVGLVGGAYGLGIVAWIAPRISSVPHWDGDVINRAIVEGYEKSREVLIFLLLCTVVPLVSGLLVSALRAFGTRGAGLLLAIAAHGALLLGSASMCIGGDPGARLLISSLAYCGLLALSKVVGAHRESWPCAPYGPDLERAPRSASPRVRCTPYAEILPSVVVAGVGLATLTPVFGHDSGALWRLSLAALGGGLVVAGGAWALGAAVIGRLTSPCAARAISAAVLLPLGALTFTNFDPTSHGFRLLVIGTVMVSSVMMIVILTRASRRTASFGGSDHFFYTSSRWFWWVLVPAVLYAASFDADVAGPIDLYHEGERVTPAAEIANGAAPYREVFLWHGLFENGIKGRLGLGFEESVAGVRRVERVFDPLALVSLYALLSVCLGVPSGGLLSAVVALYLLPSPNGRYFLPLAAYAVMTLWLTRGRPMRLAALGGFLGSLAVFYSLDGGIAAVLASSLTLVYGGVVVDSRAAPRRLIRDGVAWASGAAVGALVPLAYLAQHEALGSFVAASLDIVGGLSDRSSTPFRPFQVGQEIGIRKLLEPKALILCLPALLVVWSLAHIVVRRLEGRDGRSVLVLPAVTIGAAFFFRAVIRRLDTDHVIKIVPMLFVIVTVLAQYHAARAFSNRRRWFAALPHFLMLTAAVVLGIRACVLEPESGPARALACRTDRGSSADGQGRERQITLARAGSGVVADEGTAAWIEHVVGHLNRRLGPHETFYDCTNKGLFYFLSNRPCPTRYVQTTYAASRAAQREVVSALRSKKPRLVLFPSGDPWKYGYDWLIHPMRQPIIARYLYRNYVPAALVDDSIILERVELVSQLADPDVEARIAALPFITDVGHLPVLLGELPFDSELLQEWGARDLADAWRGPWTGETVRTSSGVEIVRMALGKRRRLTSPRLSLPPDGCHTVILTAAIDVEGEARLFFGSLRHDALDGSAVVSFRMKGGSVLRSYRIDVGLSPAWMWRGPVTRLQIEFPGGAQELEIESIELRSYVREDGVDGAPLATIPSREGVRGNWRAGSTKPPHHPPESSHDGREESA